MTGAPAVLIWRPRIKDATAEVGSSIVRGPQEAPIAQGRSSAYPVVKQTAGPPLVRSGSQSSPFADSSSAPRRGKNPFLWPEKKGLCHLS